MKFVILVLFFPLSSHCLPHFASLSQNFINFINIKQKTWVAGENFPEDTPLEDLKRLAGTFLEPQNKRVAVKSHDLVIDIPEYFDAREYWPQCQSIQEIRNQGVCGSCWAFSVAATITDRLCIASNGTEIFKYSPEDFLTCCDNCGSCSGGYMDRALDYWVKSGVVSGGDYNSNEGCRPYSYQSHYGAAPNCSTTCKNNDYHRSYSEDKQFGESRYQLPAQNVTQIQIEILKNGPVSAGFTVYSDFYSYKSGVYKYVTGEKIGGHAIKIIGWGVENGTPYWLIANSWGSAWGDLGGFFKIVRGENECGIEDRIHAGLPRLS